MFSDEMRSQIAELESRKTFNHRGPQGTANPRAASEHEAHAELDLALGEGGGEGQRGAGCSRSSTHKGRARSNPLHIERRGREPEERADLVVYAGIVCPVRDVESFRRKLQVRLLAQFVPPGQAHVEVEVVGAETGVARGSDGTFIGDVIVAVHLSSGQ